MSIIHIKKRVRLPWKDSLKVESLTDQQTTTNNWSVPNEDTLNNQLGTSNFSNLSQISVETPPSYTVSENSIGEMVNHKQGVVWPNRPLIGYHSVKEYRKRKAFQRKKMTEHEKTNQNNLNTKENLDKDLYKKRQEKNISKSCKNNNVCRKFNSNVSSNVNSSKKEVKKNKEQLTMKYCQFCGIKSSNETKSFVLNNDTYYLFYDNNRDSKTEIPFEIPLKVAFYNKSGGKIVVEKVTSKLHKYLSTL